MHSGSTFLGSNALALSLVLRPRACLKRLCTEALLATPRAKLELIHTPTSVTGLDTHVDMLCRLTKPPCLFACVCVGAKRCGGGLHNMPVGFRTFFPNEVESPRLLAPVLDMVAVVHAAQR